MDIKNIDTFKWQTHRSRLDRLKDTLQSYTWIFLALLLILVLFLGWVLGRKLHAVSFVGITPSHATTPFHATDSPSSLLEELYGSIKIPISTPIITTSNRKEYTYSEAIWQKPLKNQVLILDIDNRKLDSDGQFLHNETVSWDKLDNQASGLLNHYTYCALSCHTRQHPATDVFPALIHGYDYKFLRSGSSPDFFPSWAKPGSIADELENYQFVVFMDSDAIWNQPELPFEWLLNRWNITPDTSLAVSEDWGHCTLLDGQRCLNTGFIIAQRSERTQEILRAWADCPTGSQFPGCEKWAKQFSYDQKAFNAYIINEYARPTDVVRLSCDETDGSPGANIGCDGVFVSHFWGDKTGVHLGFANTVMRTVTERLHGNFIMNRERLVFDGTAI